MTTLAAAEARRRLGIFVWVWASQALSLLGTRMSNFALGVWVYQQTHSVGRFTLIVALGLGAGLLVAPFSGILVDQWDRRRAMIAANAMAGVRTLVLVALMSFGSLEVWQVYVAAIVLALADSIHQPAYQASMTLLIPRAGRGRANGLLELALSGSRVAAPALAGWVMARHGLAHVVAFDLITFLVALGVLLAVRLPRPEGAAQERGVGLLEQATFGWRYLRARPPLMGLLFYFAAFNAAIGLSLILVNPLVLSFSDVSRLGMVNAVIAAGGVGGALLMTVWGGPANRMWGVLAFTLLCGCGLIAGGWHAHEWTVALGLLPLSFSIPIVNACSQTIWQNKVEPSVQGRVFTMRTLVAQGTAPLSFVFAGVLADRVFAPLLLPSGALASTVGRVLGVGPGRGMGLMMVLMGATIVVLASLALARGGLLRLEEELPDANDL